MTVAPSGAHRPTAAPQAAVQSGASALKVLQTTESPPTQPGHDRFKKAASAGLVGGAATAVPLFGIATASAYAAAAASTRACAPMLSKNTGVALLREMHRDGVTYIGETFRGNILAPNLPGKIAVLSGAVAASTVVSHLTGKPRDGIATGTVVAGALTFAITRNVKTSLAMAGGGLCASAVGAWVTKANNDLNKLGGGL